MAPIRHLAAAAGTLVLAAQVAHAQWQAGVKVGFGQNGYSGASEFTWDSGPASGGFVTYQLAPVLALQLEADPISAVGTSNVAGSLLTMNADYLAFPILLQLQIPTPSGVMPYVSAGSRVAIRTSCNLQFSGGGVTTNDSCTGVNKPRPSPVSFGVAASAGLQRAFGIASFLVEGRFASGLTVETLPIDAPRPRAYGWALLTGVSFPLGHVAEPPRGPGVTPPMASAPSPRPVPTNVAAGVARSPLPALTPVSVAQGSPATTRPADPLELLSSPHLVSVNAADADVRSLLLLIAKEGGVSIVVDPDINAHVWVTLTNVPVIEALRAVIQSAHLNVAAVTTNAGVPAVVFYQLPVDVNAATAQTITSRFGVSADMARWIAENQKPPQSP